jgi:hypothetical protein
MSKTVRNIAVIALIALVIVAVPGGGGAADLVGAVISLAFLAAIAWFAWRLYAANQLTLWSLTTLHRSLLYAALAGAFMAMVATSRLWETSIGIAVWFAVLGASAFTLYYVWTESRRYTI